MGALDTLFKSVFRDYNTDGVPASGNKNTDKSDCRGIGAQIESYVFAQCPPGGRLTLTSGAPVLGSSSVSGANTVYYTPYIGNMVPVWNGTIWVPTVFSEVSQLTTDATKSPAAAAINSLYDIFVWSDAGTIRATRGPAWSSQTARGTGAGTTELTRSAGLIVNKYAVTNGPAASYGLYVGTIFCGGSAAVDWVPAPTAANGGAYCALLIWNMFNRDEALASVQDNTSYTLTASGYRAAHGSTNNRIYFVTGFAEDAIAISYNSLTTTAATAGSYTQVSLGLDSASSQINGQFAQNNTTQNASQAISQNLSLSAAPQLGWHYVQAIEQGDGSHANTFNSGSNALLQIKLRM